MNILLINYEYPPKGGGAANASYFLAHEFAKKGNHVYVLTSQYQSRPKTEKDGEVTIFRAPAISRHKDRTSIWELANFILQSFRFRKQIFQKTKPTIILAFFGIPSGAIAYFLKREFGVPYVVSLRGADVPGHMPYSLSFYHKIAIIPIKIVWKNSSAIIANSEVLKGLGQKLARGAGQDIKIITNGIDTQMFHPLNLQGRKSFSRILYVGRLSQEKDLTTLISATEKLLHFYGDSFKLNIVGDGPERKKLEKLVQTKKLKKNISFVGWVDKKTIAKFYKENDIFVLPSLDESMSNALLEAMASQLVVVVSSIKGNEKLIKNLQNGLVFRVSDPDDLALKLHQALNNKDLAKNLAESAYLTSRKYSWEKSANAYLEIFKKILNKKYAN